MYDCLITSGCSHTYGDEMTDVNDDVFNPSIYSWPQILGKFLNIDNIYNVSRPGASNNYTSRSIIKEIENHQNKKILAGIMMCEKNRFEYIRVRNWGSTWGIVGPWATVHHSDRYMEWAKKYYEEAQHDFLDTYNMLKNIHYMQLYFTNKKIDYFMIYPSEIIYLYKTQIFGPHKTQHLDLTLKIDDDSLDRFNEIIDWTKFPNKIFDNDVGINTLSDWCFYKNHKRAPKGHFLESTHKEYAELFLGPWIKETYKKDLNE